MFFKIHDLVTDHLNTLVFQKLLHQICSVKMMLASKQPDFVHHPMCRNIFSMAGTVHRPPYHSCASGRPKIFGYGPIRGYSAFGNLPGHFIYLLEEVFIIGVHKKFKYQVRNILGTELQK